MGKLIKNEDFQLLRKLDRGIRFMESRGVPKFKVAISKNSELKKKLLKLIVDERDVA